MTTSSEQPPPVDHHQPDDADPPPILGSWNRLYTLVIVLHVLIIWLFYLFTHAYA